jgi:hypothetical protein
MTPVTDFFRACFGLNHDVALIRWQCKMRQAYKSLHVPAHVLLI